MNQAAPTITWATPAPIATGIALSATQLDAQANVPGTFMYNPAVGAVLAAGTQQLTAVFSPTDTTDYSSATAHTSLVVGSTSGPTGGPVGPPTPTPPVPGPTPAGGCQLTPGASTSTIQTAINSAAANSCAAPIDQHRDIYCGELYYPLPAIHSLPENRNGYHRPDSRWCWNGMAYHAYRNPHFDPYQQLGLQRDRLWRRNDDPVFAVQRRKPIWWRRRFLAVPPGMNNLTVTYNWFYGN